MRGELADQPLGSGGTFTITRPSPHQKEALDFHPYNWNTTDPLSPLDATET